MALLICALCVVPVFAASQMDNRWMAVILIGLAAGAHQGFSANLFTFVSDTMPKYTVSSVVGFGGMAGAVGGMGFAKLVGYILIGPIIIIFRYLSSPRRPICWRC